MGVEGLSLRRMGVAAGGMEACFVVGVGRSSFNQELRLTRRGWPSCGGTGGADGGECFALQSFHVTTRTPPCRIVVGECDRFRDRSRGRDRLDA